MATILGQAKVGSEVLAPGARSNKVAELASPIAEEPAQAAILVESLEAYEGARQQSVLEPDLTQRGDVIREEPGSQSVVHAHGARQRAAVDSRQQVSWWAIILA